MSEPTLSFPQVMIEDVAFSRVLLGHNPFYGYCYYSHARAVEQAERFRDPAQIEATVLAALECGARGMMVSFDDPREEGFVGAIERACEKFGDKIPTIAIVKPGFEKSAKLMQRVNVKAVLIHGQVTDNLFRREPRNFAPEFGELLSRIRDLGLIPGASTHNAGETVAAMKGYDVAFVNTPVNKIGWFMCPASDFVLGALAATEMKVIGMKPLAMGRIPPEEAMHYSLTRPEVDLTIVGVASPGEAKETFGAAHRVLQAQAELLSATA